MTIERRVTKNGKILETTRLIPGTVEKISEPFLDGEEVSLHVDTDDEVSITYADIYASGSKRKVRESIKLSKHEINNHTIQTPKTFFRRRITQYGWTPTRLHISPEQEKAIQELIHNGTYSENDAEEVRDQIIFEKQREIQDWGKKRK